MNRSNFLLLIILIVSVGCTSLNSNFHTLEDIPHSRDKFENLWFNLNDLDGKSSDFLPIVQGYLSKKYGLEGCFIRIPYRFSKDIDYLKSQGFQPYRLSAEETVWVFRNGRAIPDQANTLADARVALFNHAKEILFIKNRGTNVWALPGGGIEANELIKSGAVREVKEETGIEISEENLQVVAIANLQFGISGQFTNIVQHFYVYTKEVESTITLEASEIDDYAWLNPDKISSEYKFRGLPISKKIVDLIFQFRSKTSKKSSMSFPDISMNIDTFKW